MCDVRERLTIRPPTSLEWPVFPLLLPKTAGEPIPYEYRVAVDQSRSAIVGVAAFADNGVQLGRLRLHTVFNRRGEGVGAQLLHCVLAEAARRGRAEVRAEVNSPEDGVLCSFLEKRGFGVRARQCTAEGDVDRIYRQLCARCARIAESDGRDWQVRPLSRDLFEEAGRLFAGYLLFWGAADNSASSRGAFLGRFELSHALMVRGALRGITLATRIDESAVFRLRVVQPEFRNTRASAALLMRTARACVASGARRLLCCYLDDAPDTIAFVRRMNMKVVRTTDVLGRPVQAGCNDAGRFPRAGIAGSGPAA
jgi:GNAT superfamily N-acetyltransferase